MCSKNMIQHYQRNGFFLKATNLFFIVAALVFSVATPTIICFGRMLNKLASFLCFQVSDKRMKYIRKKSVVHCDTVMKIIDFIL